MNIETSVLTPLVKLLMAAILSLHAPQTPATDYDRERAVVVAGEIADAVESAEKLPTSGPQAKEGAALALVAIGWHESKFREDIADCRACDGKSALCDHGTSVTAFQMKKRAWGGRTRKEVCEDGSLAASLALSLLARQEAPMPGLFQAYARGGIGMPSRPAVEINQIYERLLRKFKLKAVHKKTTEVTSPLPPKEIQEASW